MWAKARGRNIPEYQRMLLNGGSGYSADVLESMGGGEVK